MTYAHTCRGCGGPKFDGVCEFCERCDDLGIVNGRDRYVRAEKREAL